MSELASANVRARVSATLHRLGTFPADCRFVAKRQVPASPTTSGSAAPTPTNLAGKPADQGLSDRGEQKGRAS